MNQATKRKSSFFGTFLALLLLAASIWAFFNRQFLIDQFTVWQFKPTDEVIDIANRASMNDTGKFFYLAARPTLDATNNFNNECRRREQGSAILGCYKDGRIYLYDIDDERLTGIKEVTAAHEMLHAVYERLPNSQRSKLEQLLKVEEAKINDKDFAERMDYYRRNQPGQHYNELHSIIGTEVADISQELEDHYKKYFTNRQAVVNLHSGYSDKFAGLRRGADQLKARLEALSAEINTASLHYNSDVSQLNQQIASFNRRANDGDFSSQSEFKELRDKLVSRSNQLNKNRDKINSLMSEYESVRIQYNNIVDESNELQQALDSSLAPAPSI